jgi:hypothetical protein
MIKDVVVKLGLDPAADPAATYAVALAAALGAHLTGVALAYEPDILPDPSGPGARRFLRLREESEAAAAAAAAEFEKNADAAGLSATAHAITTTPSASYDLFGSIARRFDLAMVGQDDPEQPQSGTLVTEAALFESGRPVIVVP